MHVAVFCGFMACTNLCGLTGLRKQSDFLPGNLLVLYLYVFNWIRDVCSTDDFLTFCLFADLADSNDFADFSYFADFADSADVLMLLTF